MKISAPNYTQMPNSLLESLHGLTEAQLKVILCLCRQTFGWHREKATLSSSFISKATGLGEPAVRNAIKQLIEECVIERTQEGNSFAYCLVITSFENEEGSQSTPGRLATPQEAKRGRSGTPQRGRSATPNKERVKKEDKEISPNGLSGPSETTSSQSQKTDHARLVEGYTERYERRGMGKYQFSGGRDGKAAKDLLKIATVEEVLSVLDSAMEKTDEKKFWNCVHQTATLGKFAAAYNAIRAELATGAPTKIDPDFDPEEWERRITEITRREHAERMDQERLEAERAGQATKPQEEPVYEIE